ncbi:hypothetical protein OF897_17405 [Chryseobacterium formosus]|uniref:DUF559 domain-containing protein n=1 Tax=Chryseobacterium formosus TaxID=1537363 RepID=A0ABT3XVI8_9FLAO|nr:hypothetical protein [Chryseobacterium formosus]MCX8525695.1 hypothetical protein [Chryseobacterium formosus]
MKEKVEQILLEFKFRLESKFLSKIKSEITFMKPSMLGKTGIHFNFESKICIEIFFWEYGIIEIYSFYFHDEYKKINSLADINQTKDLLEYTYTPKNYQTLFYPEESFNLLIEKLKELEVLIGKL